MADIKARYTGPSTTGVDLYVELDDGQIRNVHVPQGGELPSEIDGMKVALSYRDGLLDQKDSWTVVRREHKSDAKAPAPDDATGGEG